MKNKYVIVLGIALLFSSIIGYLLQEKKYYLLSYKGKREVTQQIYESRNPSSINYVAENEINFSIMLLSFFAVLGSGLILSSLLVRNLKFDKNIQTFLYMLCGIVQSKSKSVALPISVNNSVAHNLKTTTGYQFKMLLYGIRKNKAGVRQEAYEKIAAIVRPIAHDKVLFNAFERSIVMNELYRDVNSGLFDGKLLPWGYNSKEEVQADTKAINNFVYANPVLQKAVWDRRAMMKEVRQDLVDKGLIDPQSSNEDYFHHQVHIYMNEKEFKGTGPTNQDIINYLRERAYSRPCSINDYYSKYFESEFEVLAQSLEQIRIKEPHKSH